MTLNLTGQRFNRLVVLSETVGRTARKSWWCLCDCGKELEVTTSSLRSGNTKSCGCLHIEKVSLPEGTAALNELLSIYRRNAANREIFFDLTDTEMVFLFKQNCYWCGAEPNTVMKSRKSCYVYNGIDRVDNRRGYEISNVVPCCKVCNVAKQAHTEKEFIDWVQRLYNNLFSTNVE